MPFVKVAAVPETGFWRAGKQWSTDGFNQPAVEVTDEELKQLQAEKMLHVQVVDGQQGSSSAGHKAQQGPTKVGQSDLPTEAGDLKRK